MSRLPVHALLVVFVAAGGAAGCALLFKDAPIVPRYFSPERPGDLPPPAHGRIGPDPELQLGRVEGSANIEQMLIFRNSPSEIGYYGLWRWTEAPEQYLRRRLARVLFEERGVTDVVHGRGPILDVQLTAFEEVSSPRRAARVQVVATLHDDRVVTWMETITQEQPVEVALGGDEADAVVAAIGTALRATVELIANRVTAELAKAPAHP